MKILILLIFATFAFCGDVKWLSLKDAEALSKRENRIVMVEVSAHGCKYCVEMANTTLKNDKITSKLNQYFAPVLFYNDEGNVPPKFFAKGTPTFFFIDKNGKKLSAPIFGAWNATDFEFFLDLMLKKTKEQQ